MKRCLISVLIIMVLALGLAGCAQSSSIPVETESPPPVSIPIPVLVFQLSDFIDDPHYWNLSWDAGALYGTLISINSSP